MITLSENYTQYILVQDSVPVPTSPPTKFGIRGIASTDAVMIVKDGVSTSIPKPYVFDTPSTAGTIVVLDNSSPVFTQPTKVEMKFVGGGVGLDNMGNTANLLKWAFKSYTAAPYTSIVSQAMDVDNTVLPISLGIQGTALQGDAVAFVQDINSTRFVDSLNDIAYNDYIVPVGDVGSGVPVNYNIQMVIGRYYEKVCEFNVAAVVSLQGQLPSGLKFTNNVVSGTITSTSPQTGMFSINGQTVTITFEPVKFPVIAATM